MPCSYEMARRETPCRVASHRGGCSHAVWTRVRGKERYIAGVYMTSCAKLKPFGHVQIRDNGHIGGGGEAEAGGPERRFMVVVKEDIK